MFAKAIKSIAAICIAAAALAGCATNMKVPIKDPVTSSVAYAPGGAPASVNLTFVDEQTGIDKTMPMSGTLRMFVMYQDKPLEPVSWIAQQTVREMKARGLPVNLTADGGTTVAIKRMHIENYRVNAYSPFITFTTLSADVETPQGTKRIVVYVKRGKVPVWGWDEVIDPTFNDSLSVIAKEFAAKLNQILFGQVVSDDKVRAMIASIEKDGSKRGDLFMDVYQLGFSNNPVAVPALVKLASHSDEYVRLAALSSLGILKAQDQLQFLELRAASGGLWQERGMAMKAIGDIGTPEAMAFLAQQKAKFSGGTDKEARWSEDVVALYLESSGHRMRPVNTNAVATTSPAPATPVAVSTRAPAAAPVSAPKPAPAPQPAPVVAPVPVKALASAPMPAPDPAPAPVPVPVQAAPASVSAPATVASPPGAAANSEYAQYAGMNTIFRVGESSYSVEEMTKASGCVSSKGASWVDGKAPVEYYRVACNDGRVIVARCEFRQCAEIRQ
jgi:hypothetical protein